jgi:hypothetical protein
MPTGFTDLTLICGRFTLRTSGKAVADFIGLRDPDSAGTL